MLRLYHHLWEEVVVVGAVEKCDRNCFDRMGKKQKSIGNKDDLHVELEHAGQHVNLLHGKLHVELHVKYLMNKMHPVILSLLSLQDGGNNQELLLLGEK